MIRYFLVSVLTIAGCSASQGSHGSSNSPNSPNGLISRDGRDTSATPPPSLTAQAPAYRGPAVITGAGDLAACPLAWDLEQYHNDMRNMRVDPDSPSYAVASAYDLHNRRCIELERGERVDILGESSPTETLVRPLGQLQTYWTTAERTRK